METKISPSNNLQTSRFGSHLTLLSASLVVSTGRAPRRLAALTGGPPVSADTLMTAGYRHHPTLPPHLPNHPVSQWTTKPDTVSNNSTILDPGQREIKRFLPWMEEHKYLEFWRFFASNCGSGWLQVTSNTAMSVSVGCQSIAWMSRSLNTFIAWDVGGLPPNCNICLILADEQMIRDDLSPCHSV